MKVRFVPIPARVAAVDIGEVDRPALDRELGIVELRGDRELGVGALDRDRGIAPDIAGAGIRRPCTPMRRHDLQPNDASSTAAANCCARTLAFK